MVSRAVVHATWVLSTLVTMPVWGEAPSRQALALDNGERTYTLQVEVAETPHQRSRGLMERDSLPADAGMLFLYGAEQPATSAYWMYRTRIPLDIAFIDGEGVIRSLKTMSPCRAESSSRCPVYPAGARFRAALEANAGYFAERRIEVGDRIELAPWIQSP
ncbi:MAG: DUF192 domain-containing protein [Salinicola sp.]|uniref:DUF192 domain-containing protein n=1 Tax=Salinicola sp. TaxID=1978524 RepID=UPI001DA8FDF2|nr:DUF192 domain-containing protein [Salinicola sp.]NRB55479.1 DUF192 domain-containing protein [Salinicola sp.]